MSLSLIALLVGILGGIVILAVVFSLLAVAAEADGYIDEQAELDWEEKGWKNEVPPVVEKAPVSEPLKEMLSLSQMPRPDLPR